MNVFWSSSIQLRTVLSETPKDRASSEQFNVCP